MCAFVSLDGVSKFGLFVVKNKKPNLLTKIFNWVFD